MSEYPQITYEDNVITCRIMVSEELINDIRCVRGSDPEGELINLLVEDFRQQVDPLIRKWNRK